jgi:hypothetical protein
MFCSSRPFDELSPSELAGNCPFSTTFFLVVLDLLRVPFLLAELDKNQSRGFGREGDWSYWASFLRRAARLLSSDLSQSALVIKKSLFFYRSLNADFVVCLLGKRFSVLELFVPKGI